ncbi:MAG: peptidoglycan-binding protein LysM [Algibacter sp.]|uniref:peptidoglycan-binding protein LysM n=1 Tax=Algibacter sp. TaxID=1872428 RepID=UPI002619E1B8|nr:peptidoglycan-binding protein LysM [Algibacter sp.]MDG1729224.1 peptidoglycan-binding protein LysM [Algibacter sp.]MDG2177529.1 peptidoglycan-binding protein LysM [Algibacter sp.]
MSAEAVTRKFKIETSTAKKLEEKIINLQLHVENLNVFIDTDVAIISGLAYDQATREKVVLVVGNSNGIATVHDYLTVENQEPVAQFYTVRSGDTLGKIAEVYYGNAMNYSFIFDANKPMLNHPNKIYPGQVLRIPA